MVWRAVLRDGTTPLLPPLLTTPLLTPVPGFWEVEPHPYYAQPLPPPRCWPHTTLLPTPSLPINHWCQTGARKPPYEFDKKVTEKVCWPWKSLQLFNITNFCNFLIKTAIFLKVFWKFLSDFWFAQPQKPRNLL